MRRGHNHQHRGTETFFTDMFEICDTDSHMAALTYFNFPVPTTLVILKSRQPLVNIPMNINQPRLVVTGQGFNSIHPSRVVDGQRQ